MDGSRIANVSVAVRIGLPVAPTAGPSSARALAQGLSALFEDTLVIGDSTAGGFAGRSIACPGEGRDPVAETSAAIEAARGERVIVVSDGHPRACAELVLALVAWPERAVVLIGDGAGEGGCAPACAIYRRADLEERVRGVLASAAPPPSFESFLAGLEVERVSLEQLGLGDLPDPLFGGREAA